MHFHVYIIEWIIRYALSRIYHRMWCLPFINDVANMINFTFNVTYLLLTMHNLHYNILFYIHVSNKVEDMLDSLKK